MTPYERGYAAGLKAASEEAKERAWDETGLCIDPDMDEFADYLLSLPIEGEADQRGAAATCTEGAPTETGESQNRASGSGLGAQFVPPPNPVEQVPDSARIGSEPHVTTPARPGPSQECVSDLSERLRQYADIADAGGKAHWANAMREAMYTLAVYRQNAAKKEHDAHR